MYAEDFPDKYNLEEYNEDGPPADLPGVMEYFKWEGERFIDGVHRHKKLLIFLGSSVLASPIFIYGYGVVHPLIESHH